MKILQTEAKREKYFLKINKIEYSRTDRQYEQIIHYRIFNYTTNQVILIDI